ncbi:MAG: putative 7-carboxy-7-deazaguanine synthase QueE [Oscillospiraceae bacterium]
MGRFFLVEHFVSINGEGQHAGELALFLRFGGCNLQCSYCDTAWANDPSLTVWLSSTDELCELARKSGIKRITLTGGEPLRQPDIADLIEALGAIGHSVEIETNGSIPLKPYTNLLYRPSFTMDYKLPSSGMESAMDTENFALLTKTDTVKFVAGSLEDLERAKEIIDEYHLTEQTTVYFSPVFGSIEASEMVDFMKQHQLNDIRLQLQLHKYIWNPQERGV